MSGASEMKTVRYEENPNLPEIKLTCKTLFNKRGELSSLRCAIFSVKIFLWYWLFMVIPVIIIVVIAGLLNLI